MKRELNTLNYGSFQGLSRFKERDVVHQLVVMNDNSELNRLLSIIFAPDETGSIQGDIGFVLNDKVDPQIVNFVKSQLLFDTSSHVQSPIPSWMSDDDAVVMRRDAYETMDEYATRMADHMLKLKDSMKPKLKENEN